MLVLHVHMSSLGKIAKKENLVLRVVVQPLVQLNVPAQYLNPMQDLKAKTAAEITLEKIESTVLPRADAPGIIRSPRNGPTCILAAAVWIKLCQKYFNSGNTKEACETFDVGPNSCQGFSWVKNI